jgi:hypothetical protein
LRGGEGAHFCQKVPRFCCHPSVKCNVELKTLEWSEVLAETRDSEFRYSELMSNCIVRNSNLVALVVKGLYFMNLSGVGFMRSTT